MNFQLPGGVCGPAAIVNTLRCFGVRVSQRKVKKLAGTDANGTDEFGMITALSELGFYGTEYLSKVKTEALTWLTHALGSGPVIICVDGWGHWVTVIGKSADRFIVVDSSNTIYNKRENGVHVYTGRDLIKRWYNKREGSLYAIAVAKRRKPL